jgi:hypothetical protein
LVVVSGLSSGSTAGTGRSYCATYGSVVSRIRTK